MAFNTYFNLTDTIADLSLNVRKSVLFSMCGSANAILFGAADRLCNQLLSSDYTEEDLKAITPREVEALVSGMDGLEPLDESRVLAEVADEWRSMLQSAADSDQVGLMSGTIQMMTGRQKMRSVSENGARRLATVGIVQTPAQRLENLQARLARDQERANQRAQRTGLTEFLLDQVLVAKEGATFADLSEQRKEVFCQKYLTVLDKVKQKAIVDIDLDLKWGDSLNETDILLIEEATKDALAGIYPQPREVTKTMVHAVQPKYARAPAPEKEAALT